MTVAGGVRIEGLKEFRKALRASGAAAARELTKALKNAGRGLPPKMRVNAPRNQYGEIAAGVKNVRAAGTKARIPIVHRAAAIAEFSNKGAYGQTMTARYGETPRYGYKTVEEEAGTIERDVTNELTDLIGIMGWAR